MNTELEAQMFKDEDSAFSGNFGWFRPNRIQNRWFSSRGIRRSVENLVEMNRFGLPRAELVDEELRCGAEGG